MDGPSAVICTDSAPGFKAFTEDKLLNQHRIITELGHSKNPIKSPIAEKAVQELENELLFKDPFGGTLLPCTLAAATASLNSCLRSCGLSACKMWTQRDQFSNIQIPKEGSCFIASQNQQCLTNHPYSEYSKALFAQRASSPSVQVGDLVYLHSDRNKSQARDHYLVVALVLPFCNIKKLVRHKLRNSTYRVKITECFKVQTDTHSRYKYVASTIQKRRPIYGNIAPANSSYHPCGDLSPCR